MNDKPFATFPKVPGAVAYDVYPGPGGTTHLNAYLAPDGKKVHVGTFDADGNPTKEART